MAITIDLTVEEMQYVAKVGYYRDYESRDVQNIADYDTKRFNLTGLQAHRLGAMCELATGKALGLDMLKVGPDVWPAFVLKEQLPMYDKPDILQKYEVRRANKLSSPIPIRQKDVAHEAIFIQVYVDYVQNEDGGITVPKHATLLGYSDAKADWDGAQVPSWSSNGRSRVVYDKRDVIDLSVFA